eukprot:354861-Chlamydomonas_euryale.AAC.5
MSSQTLAPHRLALIQKLLAGWAVLQVVVTEACVECRDGLYCQQVLVIRRAAQLRTCIAPTHAA